MAPRSAGSGDGSAGGWTVWGVSETTVRPTGSIGWPPKSADFGTETPESPVSAISTGPDSRLDGIEVSGRGL